jgi:hypothetical protein
MRIRSPSAFLSAVHLQDLSVRRPRRRSDARVCGGTIERIRL